MRTLRTLRNIPTDHLFRRVLRRALQPGVIPAKLAKIGPRAQLAHARRAAGHLSASARRHTTFRGGATALALDDTVWVLASRSDTASAQEAMRANLELVVDAFEHARIPYFLMPNLSPHCYRVGIGEELRNAALDALVSCAVDRPVYLASINPLTMRTTTRLLRPRRLGRRYRRAMRSRLWSVYTPVRPLDGAHPWGSLHGCQIEVWSTDGDALQATTRNRVSATVPVELMSPSRVTVHERDYDSLECFSAGDHVNDVTFPIDVVYTWVDDGDERWMRKKESVLREHGRAPRSDLATSSRFRNRDELRYSMRSLAMYVDFVRNVYLVTDDQVPDWLDTSHGGVTVVDHREIFGDEGRLPTFNSHAIECRLHKIDGLAEHYLYVNDDVFFGRHIAPDLFFLSNGLSKFFLSKAQIPLGPATEGDPGIDAAGKNNRELLHAHFGRRITQKLKHTPHAQRRSVLEEMEAEFPDEFKRTAASQFRHFTNISPAAALHHHYAYLTGRAVPGEIRYDYISLTRWDLARRLDTMETDRSFDTFCLNDTDVHDDPDALERTVAAFLERYYPIPAPWER